VACPPAVTADAGAGADWAGLQTRRDRRVDERSRFDDRMLAGCCELLAPERLQLAVEVAQLAVEVANWCDRVSPAVSA
jgi:hypothetical protein